MCGRTSSRCVRRSSSRVAVVPRWLQACSTTKCAAQPSRLASTPSRASDRGRWDDHRAAAGPAARAGGPGRRSVARRRRAVPRSARRVRGLEPSPDPRKLHLRRRAHLDVTAADRQALQVRQVLPAREVPDQDLPDVPVLLEREQLRAVADPLGGLLSHEEVTVAADYLEQPLVLLLLGPECLDAMQQLVVVQGQPALFGDRLLVRPFAPGSPLRARLPATSRRETGVLVIPRRAGMPPSTEPSSSGPDRRSSWDRRSSPVLRPPVASTVSPCGTRVAGRLVRDGPSEERLDDVERHVHPRRDARRGEHAVVDEARIAIDAIPLPSDASRPKAPQWVVARRPSSSPARASSSAPVHTEAVRRAAAAVLRIQSIVSASWSSGTGPEATRAPAAGRSRRRVREGPARQQHQARPSRSPGSFVLATVKHVEKRVASLWRDSTPGSSRARENTSSGPASVESGDAVEDQDPDRHRSIRPLRARRRDADRRSAPARSHPRLAPVEVGRLAVGVSRLEGLDTARSERAVAPVRHAQPPVRVVDQPALHLPDVALREPPVVAAELAQVGDREAGDAAREVDVGVQVAGRQARGRCEDAAGARAGPGRASARSSPSAAFPPKRRRSRDPACRRSRSSAAAVDGRAARGSTAAASAASRQCAVPSRTTLRNERSVSPARSQLYGSERSQRCTARGERSRSTSARSGS